MLVPLGQWGSGSVWIPHAGPWSLTVPSELTVHIYAQIIHSYKLSTYGPRMHAHAHARAHTHTHRGVCTTSDDRFR